MHCVEKCSQEGYTEWMKHPSIKDMFYRYCIKCKKHKEIRVQPPVKKNFDYDDDYIEHRSYW